MNHSTEIDMTTQYTYIFIRKDLSHSQQIVQASHAAIEAGSKYLTAKNCHIVLFGIDDEKSLKKASQFLLNHQIQHHIFFEPDNELGLTAIATEPIVGDKRLPLKHYTLFKGK